MDHLICSGAEYFNKSLKAEFCPHPEHPLSATGGEENEGRLEDWVLPSFAIAWGKCLWFLFLGFSLLLCKMRSLGKFSEIVGILVLSFGTIPILSL